MRDAARRFDPAGLARIGNHLLEVIDPERTEGLLARQLSELEQSATARRGLSIGPEQDGVVLGRFALPTAEAATVSTALRALAAPAPAHTRPDPWTDPDGARAAGLVRDERNHGQRMADALVEICQRALCAGDLPAGGGEKPQLVVTMSLDQLRAGGTARLIDGTGPVGPDLSPATARRLACDAGALPAGLGGQGQLLDIGRESRTVPTGLRRALLLRDGGCAFPGCDRPAAWCDAHHIRHWADGGDTALSNLVLSCGHHHRHTHSDSGWTVRIRGDDGRVQWLPPPWVDPQRSAVTGARHPPWVRPGRQAMSR